MFQHPTVKQGRIIHGGQVFPVVDGVVDCPEALARECGFARVKAVVAAPAEDAAPESPVSEDAPAEDAAPVRSFRRRR